MDQTTQAAIPVNSTTGIPTILRRVPILADHPNVFCTLPVMKPRLGIKNLWSIICGMGPVVHGPSRWGHIRSTRTASS